jgi:glutaminyl-tRNA synthetase
VHCTFHEDSKSGTPGADKYKVKGNIHWVSAKRAFATPVHLYDRLFKVANPAGQRRPEPRLEEDRPAQLEPSLKDAKPERASSSSATATSSAIAKGSIAA